MAASLGCHLTQGEPAHAAAQATRTGSYEPFLDAIRSFTTALDTVLILGKSLVGGSETGDVFDAVTSTPLQRAPPIPPQKVNPSGVTITLGGPWQFYADFWRAHAIDRLGSFIPPELGVTAGTQIKLPLIVKNEAAPISLDIRAIGASDWMVMDASTRIAVRTGEQVQLHLSLKAPVASDIIDELIIEARTGLAVHSELRLKLSVRETLPFY